MDHLSGKNMQGHIIPDKVQQIADRLGDGGFGENIPVLDSIGRAQLVWQSPKAIEKQYSPGLRRVANDLMINPLGQDESVPRT